MANYTVIAPVKKTFSGYGLTFVDGIAHTDSDALAEHLRGRGYCVEGSAPKPQQAKKGKQQSTDGAPTAQELPPAPATTP